MQTAAYCNMKLEIQVALAGRYNVMHVGEPVTAAILAAYTGIEAVFQQLLGAELRARGLPADTADIACGMPRIECTRTAPVPDMP
jgi:hypothetical protein